MTVPAIRTLPPPDVNVGVTLFVGENGSGKSTLLEGIAAASEVPAVGSAEIALDDTLGPARELGAQLRLAWSPRSRPGFFLRAEDFFGYAKAQARTDARILREKFEQYREPGADFIGFEKSAIHPDEAAARRFVAAHDSFSHGETFMRIFAERIRRGGLYLLDEPEAALSPKRQFELVRRLVSEAAGGAQFIIATHSPILLSIPGARIYGFDTCPVAQVAYDDLEHVSLTRAFLANPRAFVD